MRIIRLPYRRPPVTGRGIGGIFAKLLSFAKPVLKSVAKSAAPLAKKTLKTLGKEVLTATTSTLGDVLSGESSKEALAKNAKAGLSNVARATRKRVIESLQNGSESSIPIKRARKRRKQRRKQRGRGISKQRRVGRRKKRKAQRINKAANRRRQRPRRSIFA